MWIPGKGTSRLEDDDVEQKLSAWQLAFKKVEDVNVENIVVNDVNARRCGKVKVIPGRSGGSRPGNKRKVTV